MTGVAASEVPAIALLALALVVLAAYAIRRRSTVQLGGETARDVSLGAACPRVVAPGTTFVARFLAYAPGQVANVVQLLEGLAPGTAVHTAVKRCRWRAGIRVRVLCAGAPFEVQDSVEEFEWDGEYEVVSFDVSVPSTARGRGSLGFDVLVEGTRVGKLRLDVRIDAETDDLPQRVLAGAVKSAFVSYSAEDRARVLDRIATLRNATQIDCFMDCLALRPSERWKKRLHAEIVARDAFFLFWSRSASESAYVRWEWETCLRAKGEEALHVHPLESPDEAPPPEPLRHLHFDDPLMRIRSALERRVGVPPPTAPGAGA